MSPLISFISFIQITFVYRSLWAPQSTHGWNPVTFCDHPWKWAHCRRRMLSTTCCSALIRHWSSSEWNVDQKMKSKHPNLFARHGAVLNHKLLSIDRHCHAKELLASQSVLSLSQHVDAFDLRMHLRSLLFIHLIEMENLVCSQRWKVKIQHKKAQ